MKSPYHGGKGRINATVKAYRRQVHHHAWLHGAATVLATALVIWGWHRLSLAIESTFSLVVVLEVGCFLYLSWEWWTGKGQHYGPRKQHILEVFLDLPKYEGPHKSAGITSPYRIRRLHTKKDLGGRDVPVEEDMEAFVDLSHHELGEANPDLGKQERRSLYLRWWMCNPDTFLLLDKNLGDGTHQIIAVSIVLPLSEDGHHGLRGGEVGVLDLRGHDIVRSGAKTKHVLIDTWIVHPRFRGSLSRYEAALVMKHIALFWNPRRQREITILIEPDVRSIRNLARSSGFDGTRRTASGSQLFTYHYPHDYAGPHMEGIYRAFADKVQECQSWQM